MRASDRQRIYMLANELAADIKYVTRGEQPNAYELAEAFACVYYAQGKLEQQAALAAFNITAAQLPGWNHSEGDTSEDAVNRS